MLTEQELLELRHKYYTSFSFLRNATEYLKHKYLSFKKEYKAGKTVMHRYNRAYHSNEFKKIYEQFNFRYSPSLTMYYSLADITTQFPVLPWAGNARKIAKIQLEQDIDEYICGFDFAIDLDTPQGSTLQITKEHTIELHNEINKCKAVHYIKYSGTRGFHIRIPSQFLPAFTIAQIQEAATNFTNFFQNLHIDTFSNDRMKLWKLDYSVCKDKIALPLTELQLKHFTEEMAMLENIFYGSIKLTNELMQPRMECLYNRTYSQEEIENTSKFIKEYLDF